MESEVTVTFAEAVVVEAEAVGVVEAAVGPTADAVGVVEAEAVDGGGDLERLRSGTIRSHLLAMEYTAPVPGLHIHDMVGRV